MAKKDNVKEISRRYVTALFELAKAAKQQTKIAKEVETLANAFNTSEVFRRIATSPIAERSKQVEAAEALAKKLKLTPIARNFLIVVARNGRLGLLPAMADAYNEQVESEAGEIKATVITAAKLEAADAKTIANDLSKKTGKKVTLEQQVDESIIGGLVIRIGSKMYDLSVKSQLNKIKKELKQAS